ncbi:Protein CBG10617 [Caenorhabditis briggsae]|uniref:Protein CBG10617 n=1 Tax=Caenorhabditis briggsae TaxID=6238 RepID=A8XBH0_CAEBR|nr:Protein CBG10617 [Caenorhabditis briggsae]CAP29985.2 Protein CBG10617 [Caenorhabditis briggsae]
MNYRTYIQKGAILHNRFQVETHAGAFNGERCLYAIDLQENQQVTLKAFLPEDPRIHAHIEFFQECGGMQGIPQFIDHFSTLGSEFIAHSHKGVRLRSILNSRLFHISMENTIRLGYRLFRILHSVHLKGFLHRDIRPLTITCDVDQNEELGVNLSYFGHAARIDTPPANNPVILGPYQSLHVSRGGAYSRIDDYISIIIVMLTCQGVNPFDFNTNSHLNHIQKKENFHADPYSFLTPETAWLGDLYLQLVEMRADRFSHLQIMAALRRAVPGIDPQTVITYHNDPANGYLLID